MSAIFLRNPRAGEVRLTRHAYARFVERHMGVPEAVARLAPYTRDRVGLLRRLFAEAKIKNMPQGKAIRVMRKYHCPTSCFFHETTGLWFVVVFDKHLILVTVKS